MTRTLTTLILAALCALPLTARAQFDCQSKTVLTPNAPGTVERSGKTNAGEWSGFWCPAPVANGRLMWRMQVFAVLNKHKGSVDALAVANRIRTSADPLAAVNKELAAARIVPAPGQDAYDYAVLKRTACLALIAPPLMVPELAPPAGYCGAEPVPPVLWRVKTNGVLTTRPARALTNGVLGTREIARATVGQPCDITKPTYQSGADLWASFGPTPTAGVVALCAKT